MDDISVRLDARIVEESLKPSERLGPEEIARAVRSVEQCIIEVQNSEQKEKTG